MLEKLKGWSLVREEITCIIDHYNPSVRIIDIVYHTTYVACVNFGIRNRFTDKESKAK